jgi:hypothetical protein
MKQIDLPFAGHDPDHEELLGAAQQVAAQIGRRVQAFDVDEYALVIVHKNAGAVFKKNLRAQGAKPLPDGGFLEVIEGERLDAFGFPSSAGGLRVLIITRLSQRLVELPLSDEVAEAAGAALLGGRR